MNRTSVFTAVAAALLLGGCATQSNTETAPAPGSPSSSASSSQSRSAPAPAPAPSSSLASGGRAGARAGTTPNGRSVYYEFDQSDLKAEDRRLVEQHARYLREHPDAKVRIEGNADERGSREYNLALGQRRAEGVMRALRLNGVKDDRLEAVSYGKEKPRAEGHDEKSWAENRRSDMLYR